jgi:AcrR family transcriptional regulator
LAPTATKRSYDSPLRAKQSEQTRELILDALAAQLTQSGLADFSIPNVAERAGVSARTVYRYFPTREDQMNAVAEYMEEVAKGPAFPATPGDIPAHVRELYGYFERYRDYVEATHVAQLAGEVAERRRRHRQRRFKKVIESWLAPYDEDLGQRLLATVRLHGSSAGWRHLTKSVGLTTEQAADIAAWAIQTLFDDVEREQNARDKERKNGRAKKRPGSKGGKK